MATYNKRGYKQKAEKVEKQVEDVVEAEELESTTAEVFNALDETASKTEEFVAKNQKYIFIIIGVVAVVVLGSLAFKSFVTQPKEQKAVDSMYDAQKYFNQAVNGVEKDSLYNLALNGTGDKLGMLGVINEFGGTSAGNLANYYAGTSYLRLKQYKKAIEYLGDFSGDDEVLSALAKGNIGDAFVQLNQKQDALGYYEEAAKMRTNSFTTPLFLNKAGTLALELGDASKALTYFKRIKEEFPTSTEAANVDVFIGKAQVLANK